MTKGCLQTCITHTRDGCGEKEALDEDTKNEGLLPSLDHARKALMTGNRREKEIKEGRSSVRAKESN